MKDSITVIRSRHLRLAKRIHADGRIEAYDQAKTVDLYQEAISDLEAVASLLTRLLPRPSCAAVFGGVADPARVRGVRRLAYPDPETGDLPTLRPVPHRWCALDMDGVARPENVLAEDLLSCAEAAIQHLPEQFQHARCVVQASASHGIKPGCRLRLWFWLSRETTGEELGFWLKGYPVDPCTFRTAQPIFTAAPVFVGRRDHLPVRIAERDGVAQVQVPSPASLKPPERRPSSSARTGDVPTDADADAFINGILDRVRSAPENSKHYTLRDQARLLGGIQDKVGFSDAEAVRWLLDALPDTASDLVGARATAEWGLDVGRAAPINIPSTEPRAPDPRRKALARAAFRLLRMDVPSDLLLATLHDMNAQQDEPLPEDIIADTALWAARQSSKVAHVR